MEKRSRILLVVGTALLMMSALLLSHRGLASKTQGRHAGETLTTQNTNTYLGPNTETPGNPQLVRLQLLIYDSPQPQGVQIMSVEFKGKSISLKPRDVYGFRGQASFQVKPGNYRLKWKVRRDNFAWPRTVSHEEEVHVVAKDMWLQISIVGEHAAID